MATCRRRLHVGTMAGREKGSVTSGNSGSDCFQSKKAKSEPQTLVLPPEVLLPLPTCPVSSMAAHGVTRGELWFGCGLGTQTHKHPVILQHTRAENHTLRLAGPSWWTWHCSPTRPCHTRPSQMPVPHAITHALFHTLCHAPSLRGRKGRGGSLSQAGIPPTMAKSWGQQHALGHP